MTPTHELIKEYIRRAIDKEDAGPFAGDKARMLHLAYRFDAEYRYQTEELGVFQGLCEWLKCSVLDIAYTNVDIMRVALEWRLIDECEYVSECEWAIAPIRYYHALARNIIQMCREHNVSLT
jgi:hypothetical protein